jgi:hypothetical protein
MVSDIDSKSGHEEVASYKNFVKKSQAINVIVVDIAVCCLYLHADDWQEIIPGLIGWGSPSSAICRLHRRVFP